MASKNGGSAELVNEWVREIRSLAREWARGYKPKQDLTPLTEVKDRLYAHLVENHPKIVDVAFSTPLFTPVCTWHIIGRDVKQPLEDRGYVFVPAIGQDGKFGRTRDLLMRQATAGDEHAYISLEYDLLGALLDRQERLVANASGRVEHTKERRITLQSWLADAKTV